MKKQLYKTIVTILIAISIFAITNVAYAQEEAKINLLKNNENSYIIYVDKYINNEFLFGFSKIKEASEEDIIFSASGLDSKEENVAYMTKEIAESLEEQKAYMWVKVNEKTNIYEIDLNEAVTEEQIELVNTTTKRIEVDTSETETSSNVKEGVKITHSQGKVKITEQGNAFSYQMEKVENEETTKLIKLANKILESKDLTNAEKIALTKDFTELYKKMYSEIENWEDVAENKEILQPQESKKGDTYIVWLKNNETEEHDLQILLCDDNQDIEVEAAKKVTIFETVKLPITYDSIITLIAVLAIVVIAISVLLIAKKKYSQKEN